MRNIIAEKWRAYAGPEDERIVAERNRHYARLAKALLVISLLSVYYAQALRNAAERTGALDPDSAFLGAFQADTLLTAGVLICCIAYCEALSRQGIVESNRFAETDRYPAGYFALCSFLGALAVFVGIFAMNVLAQAQFGEVSWAGDAAMALILAGGVFMGCLVAFYVYFRSAKRNRDRIASELE